MKIAHISTLHSRNDTRILLKEVNSLAKGLNAQLEYFVQDGLPDERGALENVWIRGTGSRLVSKYQRLTVGQWRMLKAVLGSRAKIVHFHDPELIPLGLVLKLLGKRVIYDVHENTPLQVLAIKGKQRWKKIFLSRIIAIAEGVSARIFDLIVCATPHIAERFAHNNAVLVQNFPMIGELRLNRSSHRRKSGFFFVGGFSRIRGGVEMVAALGLVRQDNVSLTIAGNYENEAFRREILSSSDSAKINSLGWQDRSQVAEHMSKAIAGLVTYLPVPNHIEAQPNKLFEYMSAGLPVIASDFPLWRKIVENANCGLLVDPSDPQSIAGAMSWMLNHPDEAEKMGLNGLKAVKQTYNWDREAEKLLTAYKKIHSKLAS